MMTTYEYAAKRAAARPAGVSIELVDQADAIRRRIITGETAADLATALDRLKLVAGLWRELAYGYKASELAAAAVSRLQAIGSSAEAERNECCSVARRGALTAEIASAGKLAEEFRYAGRPGGLVAAQTWERVGKATLERVKREILADMADGTVPSSANSFTMLHDYVDANEYGGACETGEGNPYPLDGTDECHAFWSRVQAEADAWLRAGRPTAG